MNPQLSSGAIEEMMVGGEPQRPIFQVLGQKKIAGSSGAGADRYRLLLSDGVHSHSSAMLATQLNDKVENGEIDNFCVIQLEKFLCNTIPPNRRVVIILEVNVLAPGSQVGSKIGNPVSYKVGETNQAAAPQAAAAPAPSEPPQKVQRVNGPPAMQTPPAKKPNFYGNQGGPSRPLNSQNPPTPSTPGGTPARIHPIDSLTPYQNRWTIRVRITNKSQIRTWSNSRGEGKLFSMNLLDESGEIKCTAFRDQVDKYYDLVELNKVYYITKATLKTADKRYSSVNNDYEMTFNNDSQIWLCEEEDNLPTISFSFVAINELEKTEPNTIIDVIGVVKDAGELSKVTGKQSNKEITKRDISLVDQSGAQVRLTLWGSDAETFDGNGNPILALKGARLSDWGGRSLSALASSQIVPNPDIEEAHSLRGWYDSEGHSTQFNEYKREGGSSGGGSANWMTFAEVKSAGPQGDQAMYYNTKATVVFMKKENCMYPACPGEDCNKKVIDQGNGMFRCEKCNKEYPNHKWRMILSANLADHTDNQWATMFQETAECILGRPADELGALRTENEAEFDKIFTEANFKPYIFKMRGKMETYNDESRLKTVCVQATSINFRDYNKVLLSSIESMLQA